MAELRDLPIIAPGGVKRALGGTTDYHLDQLEAQGVIKFERTPAGQRATSFAQVEAAVETLREKAGK